MSTILVTGAAGSLARLTALELLRRGDEVVGVDYRPRPKDYPPGIEYYQANYNKTRIADVYKRHAPETVLHLGRVGNLKVSENKRFDLNVVGSAKIMQLAVRHKVKKLVVLSTFHIYGAHPHNHIPIHEDEPVRAMQTVPKLSDAVQLDNQAVMWTYRHRKLATVVLRPVNVVGPHINNTVSKYLRLPRIPYMAGFNPMWQFIHEEDMLRAILAVVDGDRTWGAFNVAGTAAVPLSVALRLTESPTLPVPGPMVPLLKRLAPAAARALPSYMMDFLRYPVVISDDAFRKKFGWEPKVGVETTIRSCVTRMPVSSVLGQ